MSNILNQLDYDRIVSEILFNLFKSSSVHRTYKCSRSLVSNSRLPQNLLKYLQKYFGLNINNDTSYLLENLYILLNKLENYCQNNDYYQKHRESYIPNFTMKYISPAGRSTDESTLWLNPSNVRALQRLVNELFAKQNLKQYQRSVMTVQMRDSILQRDNYTCQKCGNSVYKEPNLLLEVDHIIPISAGGKTEPNNLQTLCWKCNRSKSDKI